MLPNGYIKFKYRHVAFRHWPPKLSHVAFNLHSGYLLTCLLCKVVNLMQQCLEWSPGKTTQIVWKMEWKIYNHALRHFKQKISKPPLLPTTWPLWWVFSRISPFNKIMNGLCHLKTIQNQIGWLAIMLCPHIFWIVFNYL
jgi:hypothetical protein